MTDIALHCIFLFEVIAIIFQAIQKHHGDQCTSEVSTLKETIHYLLAKCSYWADNIKI